MDFSDAKATFGLSAVGTPTSTGASGSLLLGSYSQDTQLTDGDIAYAVRAIMCNASGYLGIDWTTGDTGGSPSFVAGTAQVETATIVAASGCTVNGTMALVVTAAGMTGSPKTVNVALTTAAHTTAALIAAAGRTALAADTDVAAWLSIGGTGANMTLTRKPTASYTVPGGTLNLYAANDATLNLAIPSGLGVTAAGTSTNTTAGVVSSGCKIYDGDGKDLEGVTLPTGNRLLGIKIELASTDSAALTLTDSSNTLLIDPGATLQMACTTGSGIGLASMTFTPAAGPNDISLTFIAATV